MMLNPGDNIRNLKLFIDNGLNIQYIDKLDSTILCIPYQVNNLFIECQTKNNKTIFVNNNIAPEYDKFIVNLSNKNIDTKRQDKIIKIIRQNYNYHKNYYDNYKNIYLETDPEKNIQSKKNML